MDSALFDQSYWLGGGTCCGKSTVAAQLSRRFGLQHVKRTDDARLYDDRVSPVDHPAATEFLAHKRRLLEGGVTLIDDPLPLDMVAQAFREFWALALEDVRNAPPQLPTLYEGTRMPPDAVLPILPDPRCAAWLAPSIDVLRTRLRERDSVGRWAPGVEPEDALERLTQMFYDFSEALAQLAETHGGVVLRCEAVEDRDGLADRVASSFGLL